MLRSPNWFASEKNLAEPVADSKSESFRSFPDGFNVKLLGVIPSLLFMGI